MKPSAIDSTVGPEVDQPSASVTLLAALRESAEYQRKLLQRIAADEYRPPEERDRLERRASGLFDLLEVINRAERQCAANAGGER